MRSPESRQIRATLVNDRDSIHVLLDLQRQALERIGAFIRQQLARGVC